MAMTSHPKKSPFKRKRCQFGEDVENVKSSDKLPLSPDVDLSNGSESSKGRKRQSITANACNQCRKKKSKCDGKRPICGRCDHAGLECAFVVAEEGVTKMQSLRRKCEYTSDEMAKYHMFFDALKSSSDRNASSLLARLRMGEDIESLVAVMNPTQYAQLWPLTFPPDIFDPYGHAWTTRSERCESLEQPFSMPGEGTTFSHISDSATSTEMHEDECSDVSTQTSGVDPLACKNWNDAMLVDGRYFHTDFTPHDFKSWETHLYDPALFPPGTNPGMRLVLTE